MRDKAVNITKNPKHDRYQRGLASMAYNPFDKKIDVEQLKMKMCQRKSKLKSYINQLLKNVRKEKYTHRQYLGYWPFWYAINKKIS